MGVLACDRRDCDNIMCDYYSNAFGYLCWECYNELFEKCDSISIQDFMDSSKVGDEDPWKKYAIEIIEEEFKSRFDED